jgi:nucleoside-diphosphate-sugar epimerase
MRRILLTGASGFIGRHLSAAAARSRDFEIVAVPRGTDLRDRATAHAAFSAPGAVDVIVHAADVGGDAGWAAAHAGTQFVANMLMAVHVVEAWRDEQPGARLVGLSSLWAYPERVEEVVEDQYWSGRMHAATEHYGLSKKVLGVGIQAMRREHGLAGTMLVLGNVYGPGDTSWRVIPSLMRRIAGHPPVLEVFGDGSETRDFVYIDDQIAAILRHLDYDGELLNITSGVYYSIRDVVTELARLMNYRGEIRFTAARAAGVAGRRVNVARAQAATGWPAGYPLHSLEEGLRKTVESMQEK